MSKYIFIWLIELIIKSKNSIKSVNKNDNHGIQQKIIDIKKVNSNIGENNADIKIAHKLCLSENIATNGVKYNKAIKDVRHPFKNTLFIFIFDATLIALTPKKLIIKPMLNM